MAELTFADYQFLAELGLDRVNDGCFDGTWRGSGEEVQEYSPITGKAVAKVRQGTKEDLESCLSNAEEAFKVWRNTPAPIRGDIIRQIGDAVRQKKEALGKLVSLVMGKIYSEGLGEVQEFIDICDFALGLSRQLEGKVLPSERPKHQLLEMWNPLGICGVITAFNFPCAVFGWNSAIALACGNCVIWKGSPTTQLVTIALVRIVTQVLIDNGLPPAIVTTVTGPVEVVGEGLIRDPRVKLVSFTGSTKTGKYVSQVVHERFGKVLLELGGNNAVVVMDDADVELALRACVFAAAGTAGQRCTSLRRMLIHESVYDTFKERLVAAYKNITIGDPLDSSTLMGPLHSQNSVNIFLDGIERIKTQGGNIITGGNAFTDKPGYYVEPTIAEISHDADIVKEELFCPILYIFKFSSLEEGIALNNSVPQGLSSGIFTTSLKNMWEWLGPNGSDTGLVNVNMGPSGAEIGGAFGGEKETGGGRESGSDAWKQYMRRSTCAINYSDELPLAQGVKFDI